MSALSWDQLKTWLLEHQAIDDSIDSPHMIKRLDLSGRSLKELPESFALLDGLTALNLSNNKLHALPDSFHALKSLSNLNIRRNRFESLPDVLAQLPLRSLNANGNQIDNVSVLSKCKDLRVLDLSVNSITSMDIDIKKENELRVVNLSSNYLKDLRGFFTHFCHVERLDLSGNLITAIPSSVENMHALVELKISDNSIEHIDDALFSLALESIDLSSNQITRLKLKGLADLETMVLDFNPIEQMSVSDDFAPYLASFSCDGCGLKAFVPLHSTALKTLCYSSNEITSVPENISQYEQLSELDIDGNAIVDLPDSMGNLTQLKTLFIEGNPLSDTAKKVIDILQPEICDIHMKRGITIEKARAEDLREMAELLSILFAIEQDFTVDYDKQLAGITKLYHHKGKDLLVAKHEGSVVGMVTMQRLISSAEGDYIGQIEDLVVKENYRKMGVGSRLINKMRALAQEHGYKRIQLAADIDNENALRFYSRRGFHQTHLKVYHYNA